MCLIKQITDSLYTVTNHLQVHVTHVIPITRLSDVIGPSFRQYVDYANYTVHTGDQSSEWTVWQITHSLMTTALQDAT